MADLFNIFAFLLYTHTEQICFMISKGYELFYYVNVDVGNLGKYRYVYWEIYIVLGNVVIQ